MGTPTDKPLVWLHGEVRTPPLSAGARLEAGVLLRRLQRGESLSLPHSRPMPTIGGRCHELRIVDEDATWRLVYRTDADAIVIAEVRLRRTGRHEGVNAMEKAKKGRLAAAGWRSGDAAEFLELSAEEAAFVELKLALADYLHEIRTRNGWTQAQTARRLGSSQSRVAKMEAADTSVSLDLLVKSLLSLGVSRSEVGSVIAKAA